MNDRYIEKFYDDILFLDIKPLIELIASMSNSYRLLVGAAEEFNRISLAHRHDVEEAIERADNLGDIIDDAERELKQLMKLYLRELVCKIEVKQLYNDKLSLLNSSKLISREISQEAEDKNE